MSAQLEQRDGAPSPAPKRTRTLHNYMYLTAANLGSKVFSFVALLVMLRVLGVGLFGNYQAVLAFVGLFGVLTDFGLNTLAVRDLSQDPSLATRYLSNLLALRLVISAIVVVAIVVLAQTFVSSDIRTAVYVYALALIPISLVITFGIVFQFRERMAFSAIIGVSTSAITALGSILALWSGHHVLALVVVFAVANAAGAAVSAWFVYTRLEPLRFEVSVASWPAMLRKSAPFFTLTLLLTLYYRADMQILYVLSGCAHQRTCTPVGQYGAAYRPLDVLGAIFYASINTAILPMLNRMVMQSREALRRVMHSATILLLAFGVPVALLGTFYAPEALRILTGHTWQAYTSAIPALAVLIWAFPLTVLESVWFNALYALHKQSVVTMAFGITAVFNIGLNLLLIPHFSYMASSALTVASEVLNSAIVIVALRRSLGPLGLSASLVKITAIVVVTALLLWVLRPLGIFVGLPLGVIVMLAGLRLSRIFDTSEREILAAVPLVGRYARLL